MALLWLWAGTGATELTGVVVAMPEEAVAAAMAQVVAEEAARPMRRAVSAPSAWAVRVALDTGAEIPVAQVVGQESTSSMRSSSWLLT